MVAPVMASGDDDGWQAAYRAARAAWPEVTLAFDRFVAHAGQVGFAPPRVADERDDANAADLLLACACADGERAALRVLEEQVLAKTRSSLKRLDSRPEFIDDVMQELRAKLLLPPDPRILRYGGRGPLLAWVRVSASRIAIDLMRTSHEDVLARAAGAGFAGGGRFRSGGAALAGGVPRIVSGGDLGGAG